MSTPAAFIVSVVGLFKDTAKGPAIAGTAISGAAGVLFFLMPLILYLCLSPATK